MAESSVEALAAELRLQGEALKAHVDGCGKLAIEAAKSQRATAKVLRELSKNQKQMHARMQDFEAIAKVAKTITGWGKRGLVIFLTSVITAYGAVLVENYILQTRAEQAADAAKTATTTGQSVIVKKLNSLGAQ